MSCTKYDTIVVGLGAAGVTAAAELAKEGKSVLGLEAQGRIGGRVNTVPFGDGVVELGAEWIHGENPNKVFEVAKEAEIPIVQQNTDLNFYRSDGKLLDDDCQAVLNDLLMKGMDFMEKMPEKSEPFGDYAVRKLLVYIKEKYPNLLKDEDFLDQFIELFELFANNHSATDNWNDMDARDKFTPVDGYQYNSWHKYGFMTFFDIMLNTYNNAPGLPTLDVKLNTEVIQIKWPEDPKDIVRVTTKDGAVYTANNVIVTVSLGVLKECYKSLFTPKLPQSKSIAIEKMSIGVMDKIILSFEEAWWPNVVTFFGFLWKGEDRRKVGREDYWITRIYGASTPLGCSNALTLWTSGEVAKMVELLPEKVVKQKCVKLLQMFMGGETVIPEPTGMIRSKWHTNPFTRGSYTFDSTNTSSQPNLRADLRSPLTDASGQPRVLFAGEATDEIRSKWQTNPFTRGSYTFDSTNTSSQPNLREDLRSPLSDASGQPRVLFAGEATDEIRFSTVHGACDRSKWHTNPFTRGSYSFDSINTSSQPNLRADLRSPLTDASGQPRVLFAGEATDEIRFSTVHGACDSGAREARRLLRGVEI